LIATSGFLTALECSKFVFGRGSAWDPNGGAYSTPPDPVTGLWGLSLLLRGGRGKGEGKGNGRKEEGKRRDAPPPTQIPGSGPGCGPVAGKPWKVNPHTVIIRLID